MSFLVPEYISGFVFLSSVFFPESVFCALLCFVVRGEPGAFNKKG